MATYTTHYNLKKPALADKIRIADFNGNADTIDATMYENATLGAQLKADIGIVENTNTASHNISAGQYVIWKGSLYTASSAISSGATLSDANLTAVSGGGLNALNNKRQLTITAGTHTVIDENDSYICGKVMVINFKCHATSAIVSSETIAIIEETTVFDCVVPLAVGGEWTVTGVAYGYVAGKSVIAGNINNGQYVHVNFTTLLA